MCIGFATYISYFGIKSISPEYEPDKQWMTGYRKRALQIDGNIDTHPLVNISSPMFYFDGISYSKVSKNVSSQDNIVAFLNTIYFELFYREPPF